jgi:L-lactate utilization protein LutC
VEAALMSRDNILHRIRTGVGRSAGQEVADPPTVRLRVPEVDMEARIDSMIVRIEALAGKCFRSDNPRGVVAAAIAGKTAVASNSRYLEECGITALPGVRSGIKDREELRALCASADVGITSADYALADTGTLVMLASPQEARLVSLLPPAHIAVVPRERILTGLDELFTMLPNPAAQTSSMVLITGPSRTADIEQILVRGVHGPGQITVVVV